MGNCFGFLKNYQTKHNSNQTHIIPIGTPVYFDISNNNYTQEVPNNVNNPNNPNNPNIIVINQQHPNYDNGLSTMNGFFTGMLMGEIIGNDCL